MKDLMPRKSASDYTAMTNREKCQAQLQIFHFEAQILKEYILYYEEMQKPEYWKPALLFPIYSRLIYQSVEYRIIFGLAKIFKSGNDLSLFQLLNYILQCDDFNNNDNVKQAVCEGTEGLLNYSEDIKILTRWRNKLFAHLDKQYAFSYDRLIMSIPLTELDTMGMCNCAIDSLEKVYMACFGAPLKQYERQPISIPNIRMLQNFNEIRSKAIYEHPELKKWYEDI